MDPYKVLGLKRGATLEEIRQRYKHLAKLNHPDRLHNIDEAEKKQKEEFFKRVTVAYHLAMDSASDGGSAAGAGSDAWGWDDMKEVLMNTLVDVATKYIQRKEHRIRVPVEMEDVYLKRQKKLQIFLKGVDAPVMLTVGCHKGHVVTDIITEDGSVHKVHLHIQIKDHPLYFFSDDGDVVANLKLSWSEYIQGKREELVFLDGSIVTVEVPPFADVADWHLHPSGRFRICLSVVCPHQEWWRQLSKTDQETIIKLMEFQRT